MLAVKWHTEGLSLKLRAKLSASISHEAVCTTIFETTSKAKCPERERKEEKGGRGRREGGREEGRD